MKLPANTWRRFASLSIGVLRIAMVLTSMVLMFSFVKSIDLVWPYSAKLTCIEIESGVISASGMNFTARDEKAMIAEAERNAKQSSAPLKTWFFVSRVASVSRFRWTPQIVPPIVQPSGYITRSWFVAIPLHFVLMVLVMAERATAVFVVPKFGRNACRSCGYFLGEARVGQICSECGTSVKQ